ncbi:MAG: plastocyanin/azurin family copper-binding protein [Gemmatimonadota bacterium]
MRISARTALLCTVLLAACFSDPPAGPEEDNGEAVVVRMTAQLTFEPATVQVAAGQSVRWENVSVLPHTATGDPARAADPDNVELPPGAAAWDSGIVNAGGTYTQTFTTPGTYRYVCLPHESGGMVGTVEVVAGS